MRHPSWDDTIGWQKLLREAGEPETRAELVRLRLLLAGAVEVEDRRGLSYELPAMLLELAASLRAQAALAGLAVRSCL